MDGQSDLAFKLVVCLHYMMHNKTFKTFYGEFSLLLRESLAKFCDFSEPAHINLPMFFCPKNIICLICYGISALPTRFYHGSKHYEP